MKSSSGHFQWRVICGIFSRHHYVLGTEHVLPVLFIQCTSMIHEPCLISIGSRDTHNSYDGDAHSKLTSQISMLLRSFIVTALSCVRKDGPTILRLSSSLPNYSFYNLPWSRCQLCWRACAINQEATIFPPVVLHDHELMLGSSLRSRACRDKSRARSRDSNSPIVTPGRSTSNPHPSRSERLDLASTASKSRFVDIPKFISIKLAVECA